MTEVRLFLSSPGDVAQERQVAARVIARLDAEFGERAHLNPYFWEYEPMVITKDYQEQIPPPSTFDIVICILWSRMGSRMHSSYQRADGSAFRSGTEFEFVDAVEGQKRNDGTPDILVWVNKTQPRIPLEPEDTHMERLRQWRELKSFLEEWTRDDDERTFKGALNRYGRLDEFEEKLEIKLRKLIQDRLSLDTADRSARTVTWTQGSPFRGLETFHVEHAPVFFGRTAQIASVIEILRKQAQDTGSGFLMVSGGSGSGKSSLVRAGVLPMLTQPGVIEGVGLWRYGVVTPSMAEGGALESLVTGLQSKTALPEITSDGTAPDDLLSVAAERPEELCGMIRGALSQAAALQRVDQQRQLDERVRRLDGEGRSGDADLARKHLKDLGTPQARLVLVVDQFEEILVVSEFEEMC